jgi:hypothetical protein
MHQTSALPDCTLLHFWRGVTTAGDRLEVLVAPDTPLFSLVLSEVRMAPKNRKNVLIYVRCESGLGG